MIFINFYNRSTIFERKIFRCLCIGTNSRQQMRMQNDILMRENEEQFQIEEQIQEVQVDIYEFLQN